MTHAVDWYPTILSMAGVNNVNDHGMDGINMWGAIKTNSTGKRNEIVYNINDALRYVEM